MFGAAEAAKLMVILGLDDNLSGPLKKVSGSLAKVDRQAGRTGASIGKGMKVAAVGITAAGAAAATFIGANVRAGLDNLVELENATASLESAIRETGIAGKVSAAQIIDWSNQIETAIGAAFDDKAIAQATTTLIRYGNVAPANLQKAMVVMTDLAAKTGDVSSASETLAKALADPTKASRLLRAAGVRLTKAQDEQIKKMVEAGKVGEAQALILELVAERTKGAAEATQGPYAKSLSLLKDAVEDAQMALAKGFLPVIERVRDWLTKKLADKNTLRDIENFGRGLANAFDDVLDFAQKIPWAQIGDGMRAAGTAARTILDAFTSLPPWVQTAVITGWGLNKVSGGLLSGVVTELGKGLIKGVLGMTAGVVNIKAGVVTGAGGVPGGGGGGGTGPIGGAAGAAGIIASMGGAAAVASVVASVAAGAALLALPYIFKGAPGTGAKPIAIQGGQGTLSQTQSAMMQGLIPSFVPLAERAGSKSIVPALKVNTEEQRRTKGAITAARVASKQDSAAEMATEKQAIAAIRTGSGTTSAKLNTANARLAAIQRKRTTFTSITNVNIPITIRDIQNVQNRRRRIVRRNQLATI